MMWPSLKFYGSGENNYYMYYGPNNDALQYRICIVNESKIHKAVNVQVTLESIDPPRARNARPVVSG